jgi:hypothetical protein
MQIMNNKISRIVQGQTLTAKIGNIGSYAAAVYNLGGRRHITLQQNKNLSLQIIIFFTNSIFN